MTATVEQITPIRKAPDLMPILKRMRDAARGRPAPSLKERLADLEKLEKVLLEKQDEVAAAISADFGHRSKHESLISEIFVSIECLRYTKKHLAEWMAPEKRRTGWAFWPAKIRLEIQPLGVIGIISPWNYPFQLAIAPLIGALAAGNRAMIKPSEFVPATAEIMEKILASIFPTDKVAVVNGGPEVGEAFARLPFDHLVFTGSTRVGKIVMRAAAENLVPVTLELGGKSPAIVGEDVSIEEAAGKIMLGKMFNAGQTCIAPDYVLVPEAKRDAFVEAARAAVSKMYPRLAENPDYTAVVNERHYQRLSSYVEDAKAKGAKVVELNPASEKLDPSRRKMAPALVLEPRDEMVVMQEEIFGPLLPIRTYRSLDEAIEYVNDHPRPLALYYFGWAKSAIQRVVRNTISGGVTVNDTMLHFAQDDLPFGGVGPSGMGHYHAYEGFEALSKKKPVFEQARVNGTFLLRPPYGAVLEKFLGFVLRR